MSGERTTQTVKLVSDGKRLVPAVVYWDTLMEQVESLRADRDAHQDDAERLRKLLALVILDCGFLHHGKADQHLSTAPCPVEARIRAELEKR